MALQVFVVWEKAMATLMIRGMDDDVKARLHVQAAEIGGVDLAIPRRDEHAGAADFSA